MTDRSMLAHLRAVPWRLDQHAFKAWRQGLTGEAPPMCRGRMHRILNEYRQGRPPPQLQSLEFPELFNRVRL